MRSSLGRGLQSLIPKRKTTTSSAGGSINQEWPFDKKESVFNVEVDKIRPNPFQPRQAIPPESLKELAESIREHGLIQPLVVSKIERTSQRGQEVEYELIAGERRWRAAKMIGLPHVPVVIRQTSPQAEMAHRQKLELALVENLQRENINPIEAALAYKRLHHEFGLSYLEIGKKVGKSTPVINNFLRLLGLPKQIQQAIADGRLGEGHGRAILMAKPEARLKIFRQAIKKNLTVRQIESLATTSESRFHRPTHTGKPLKNPFFKKLERELFDKLAQRVEIYQKGRAGRLVISFNSRQELKKIVKQILQ